MSEKQNQDASKQRSVINWTPDQLETLSRAAHDLGQTVPSFCRTAALEKARKVNSE